MSGTALEAYTAYRRASRRRSSRTPFNPLKSIENEIELSDDLDKINNNELEDVGIKLRTEPFSDYYTVECELGRGKFATVKKCKCNTTGEIYAAKVQRKRRKAKDARNELIHEIKMLAMCKIHPGIIGVKEVFETRHEMIIITDFACGGELYKYIEDTECGFSENVAQRLLQQTLEGLAFLHMRNVVHMDIKPQNILMTGESIDSNVILCDLGFSRTVNSGEDVREIVGTPDFVAPEVLSYEPINTSCDMWSVGILTYMMLTGHSPFAGNDKMETFSNITQARVEFPDELFYNVSEEAKDFITKLLIRNPTKRMTSVECLEHPWLEGAGAKSDSSDEDDINEDKYNNDSASFDEEGEDEEEYKCEQSKTYNNGVDNNKQDICSCNTLISKVSDSVVITTTNDISDNNNDKTVEDKTLLLLTSEKCFNNNTVIIVTDEEQDNKTSGTGLKGEGGGGSHCINSNNNNEIGNLTSIMEECGDSSSDISSIIVTNEELDNKSSTGEGKCKGEGESQCIMEECGDCNTDISSINVLGGGQCCSSVVSSEELVLKESPSQSKALKELSNQRTALRIPSPLSSPVGCRRTLAPSPETVQENEPFKKHHCRRDSNEVKQLLKSQICKVERSKILELDVDENNTDTSAIVSKRGSEHVLCRKSSLRKLRATKSLVTFYENLVQHP